MKKRNKRIVCIISGAHQSLCCNTHENINTVNDQELYKLEGRINSVCIFPVLQKKKKKIKNKEENQKERKKCITYRPPLYNIRYIYITLDFYYFTGGSLDVIYSPRRNEKRAEAFQLNPSCPNLQYNVLFMLKDS